MTINSLAGEGGLQKRIPEWGKPQRKANTGITQQLSEEKTQIVHTTQGFDFLGRNIRHYKDTSSKTGYKLLTKPSQKAIKEIRHKIRQTWLKYKSNQVKVLIAKLNPIIRGWANYHRKGVARKTFESLDQWMHTRARRYAKRKHPNKNETWRKQKYFGRFNLDRKDKWVFGDHDSGIHLLKFTWFDIERHVLIPGKSSPDDPNPEIQKWFKSKRKRKSKDYKKSWQKIARRNYHRYCDMSNVRDSLWFINHRTFKVFLKQKKLNRYKAESLLKIAFPTVSYSENRFVNVKGEKSPFDGDLTYWSERESKLYDGTSAKLLKKQNHTCARCGMKFLPGEDIHMHHIDGNHGNWKTKNLEMIHQSCHQYTHMSKSES